MPPESPYQPPSADVRDIAPSDYEKRLLRRMARFFDDPPRRLARHRLMGRLGGAAGFVCMVVGIGMVDAPNDGIGWTLLATLGGVLTGLAIVYRTSARNWPILGRYFDAARLRADCEKLRD